jgi:hypothetical protein
MRSSLPLIEWEVAVVAEAQLDAVDVETVHDLGNDTHGKVADFRVGEVQRLGESVELALGELGELELRVGVDEAGDVQALLARLEGVVVVDAETGEKPMPRACASSMRMSSGETPPSRSGRKRRCCRR